MSRIIGRSPPTELAPGASSGAERPNIAPAREKRKVKTNETPLTLLLTTVLLAIAFNQSHAGVRWVEGDGRSCNDACEVKNLNAARAGHYTEGGTFYVCRSNVGGEGSRPGFNLTRGRWARTCTVGYGSGAREVGVYDCLCVDD
jgi:hypothetical protein